MVIKIEHDRPNCIGCLTPDTLIVGPYGAKPIQEIKVGDLVLTSNGSYQPVTGVMAHHHEGKIYELKIRSMGSIHITEEHPVLVATRKTFDSKHFEFNWIEAANLKTGDLLVFPVVSNSFLNRINSVATSNSSSSTSIQQLTSVQVDSRNLLPISEFIEKDYSGNVHNFEVASTEDYCTSAGIVHNCAACAGVSPDFWEMNADGKSDIKNSVKREDEWEELDIEEKDYATNLEAAQSCPVNVIHLKKKETGEKII